MNKLNDWILDCASGPFGSNLKVECFVESGFPIIDGANMSGVALTDNVTKFVTEEKARSLQRSIAKRHDVVVTISGTLGQVVYVPLDSEYEEYLCSQRQFRVTFDESKVDVEYLVYYLHTTEGQKKILSFANYVGVPALSQPLPNFKNIEVDFPDVEEQHRRIARIKAIDDKIANNNAISSNLEAMAKLLYDYWFVQFDFPDENGKPYKSSGGKMVWNEDLKREIPAGWTVSRLGNECEILLGGTPDTSKAEYWDGDIPWLNSGEVAFSPVLSAEKTITKKGMNNSATAFAEAGAVVMSITRYIRPSVLGIDACFNQSVVAVKPTEIFHTSYLYPLMKSNVDRYMKLRTGAQQPHINKEIVENTMLICPSENVLNEYYQLVENLYAQQMNASKETQQLASLRDFLLPMLMNGQVKVC